MASDSKLTFFVNDMFQNEALTARFYARSGLSNSTNKNIFLGYSPLRKDQLTYGWSHMFDKAGGLFSGLFGNVNKAFDFFRNVGRTSDTLANTVSQILGYFNNVNSDENIKQLSEMISTEDGLTKGLSNESRLGNLLTTSRLVSTTEDTSMFTGTEVSDPFGGSIELVYLSGMNYGPGNDVCNVKKELSKLIHYTIGDVTSETDLYGILESPNGFKWTTGFSNIDPTSNNLSESGTFFIQFGDHDKIRTVGNLLVNRVNIHVSPYLVKDTGDYYYAIAEIGISLEKMRTRRDLIHWLNLSTHKDSSDVSVSDLSISRDSNVRGDFINPSEVNNV